MAVHKQEGHCTACSVVVTRTKQDDDDEDEAGPGNALSAAWQGLDSVLFAQLRVRSAVVDLSSAYNAVQRLHVLDDWHNAVPDERWVSRLEGETNRSLAHGVTAKLQSHSQVRHRL